MEIIEKHRLIEHERSVDQDGAPRRTFGSIWLICTSILFSIAFLILQCFDGNLASGFRFENLPGDVARVVSLSEIFGHGFGVLLVVCAVIVLCERKRRRVVFLLSCSLIPGVLVNLLKMVVSRARPLSIAENSVLLSSWFPCENDNGVFSYELNSFPSGHAATAVGLAIGMSILFPKGKYFFSALAVLACIQRISSGSHWASDVAFGAAISFVVCGIIQLRVFNSR